MRGRVSRNSKSSRIAKQFELVTASNAQDKVGLTCKTYTLSTSLTGYCIEGGWDPVTGEFEKEINAQIDLAFENVERCLRDAGGKGWSQVYRVNSYHVPINNEALAAMVRNFRKWMPNHQPLWTCVGVPRLGEDDMRVEIEVVAHVG